MTPTDEQDPASSVQKAIQSALGDDVEYLLLQKIKDSPSYIVRGFYGGGDDLAQGVVMALTFLTSLGMSRDVLIQTIRDMPESDIGRL